VEAGRFPPQFRDGKKSFAQVGPEPGEGQGVWRCAHVEKKVHNPALSSAWRGVRRNATVFFFRDGSVTPLYLVSQLRYYSLENI
jgi:hypothetical protein